MSLYTMNSCIRAYMKSQKDLQENVFILFWWNFGGIYLYLSAFLSVLCEYCALNIYHIN